MTMGNVSGQIKREKCEKLWFLDGIGWSDAEGFPAEASARCRNVGATTGERYELLHLVLKRAALYTEAGGGTGRAIDRPIRFRQRM